MSSEFDKMRASVRESIGVKQAILDSDDLMHHIYAAAQLIEASLRQGHRIFFCGNGGSAADAQHLSAELSGKFNMDRPPLKAVALHCNTSYLTAVANDYSYEEVFARLLRGEAEEGDIVVGISTSGRSKNILRAYDAACAMKVGIISLTGATGGDMAGRSDVAICVPSTSTPRIQEAHIMIGHIICDYVERTLFGDKQ